jgi:hypothetical protein
MRRLAAVAALGLVLLLGACSDSGNDASDAAPTPTESGDDTGSPPADLTPEDQLDRALEALGTSYAFAAQLTTAAGDTVNIAGYRIGDAQSYQLTAGGETIDNITIGSESWVRDSGSDEWSAVEGVGGGDPLSVFSSPVSITADGDSAAKAVYDAAALDLDDDGTIEITISYSGNSVTFSGSTGVLELSSTLTARDNLSAIVAPI